jgi:hypothetical protein
MEEKTGGYNRLNDFFSWTNRRTFWDLNFRDKKVTDYISSLLTDFARERIFTVYGIRRGRDWRVLSRCS